MEPLSSAAATAAGTEADYAGLRDKLAQHMQWPADYTFKFVVPAESRALALELLGEPRPSERPSRNGRYVSLTSRRCVSDPDAVIAVYRALAVVPGIISL